MRYLNSLLAPLLMSMCAAAIAQDDAPGTATAQASSAPALRDPAAMSMSQLLTAARSELEADDIASAKVFVAEVFRRDETSIEGSLIDAEIATGEHDIERARVRYRAVLAVEANDFDANLGMGQIYLRTDISRQALFYLLKAAEVVPRDRVGEVMTLVARAYRGAGQRAQSLKASEAAVAADPDRLESWHFLISLRIENADFEHALLESEKLVERAQFAARQTPVDQASILRLHDAYQTRLGVFRAFHAEHYEKNPDGSISDRLKAGAEAEAAETLRQVVEVMVLLAEVQKANAYFDIVKFAERAAGYDDTNVEVLIQYGLLLTNTSQFTKAREVFEEVLAIDPDHQLALTELRSLPKPPPDTQPAGAGAADQ